jgi:hypothetical protein
MHLHDPRSDFGPFPPKWHGIPPSDGFWRTIFSDCRAMRESLPIRTGTGVLTNCPSRIAVAVPASQDVRRDDDRRA